MIPERLHWQGQGPKLLFLPGWNTPSRFLGQSIPAWFTDRWCCGLLEWPGMGRREPEPPPSSMGDLVAEIASAMQAGPMAGVIGFCLGGVAAWEHARQFPVGHPLLILVETPYHFPLVLAPLLLPWMGPQTFRVLTRTHLGRSCLERVLFRGGREMPAGFWAAFGGTHPVTAQAYLKVLKHYERALPEQPSQPSCPCHRVAGSASPPFLAWPWGRIHAIHAEEEVLEGVGHFPASEAPEAFFRLLDTRLSATAGARGTGSGNPDGPRWC